MKQPHRAGRVVLPRILKLSCHGCMHVYLIRWWGIFENKQVFCCGILSQILANPPEIQKTLFSNTLTTLREILENYYRVFKLVIL